MRYLMRRERDAGYGSIGGLSFSSNESVHKVSVVIFSNEDTVILK